MFFSFFDTQFQPKNKQKSSKNTVLGFSAQFLELTLLNYIHWKKNALCLENFQILYYLEILRIVEIHCLIVADSKHLG